MQREDQVMKYISGQGEGVNSRIAKSIDKIKKMNGSSVKRNHILKLLQDEIANASKTDTSFFKAMELDLEDNHQAQVNAALEAFVAKSNLAKKSERLQVAKVFKRKEALENKLFKIKYSKLLRTISDTSNLRN